MTREFRLQQLMIEHLARLDGNLSALASAIAEAHAKATGERRKLIVNRAKLKAIIDGKISSLRLMDLEALDDFLNLHHQGLAFVPIFVRPGLLPTLVAKGCVHTILGARETRSPQGVGTLAVSHFDTRAHADLVHMINNQGARATFELHLVILRANREKAIGIVGEHWQEVLATEQAVVSFASPVANHATETMLATMFGVEPFQPPEKRTRTPEIAFVLPDQFRASVFSSFVEGPESLEPEVAREIQNLCWALRVGKQVFVAGPENEQNAVSYGVLVAQQRANGQIRVVAAGLHGAGTHAAALAIPAATMSLESGRPGQNGPIHVSVVEAHVTYTTSASGTKIRKVESQQILTKHDCTFEPSSLF